MKKHHIITISIVIAFTMLSTLTLSSCEGFDRFLRKLNGEHHKDRGDYKVKLSVNGSVNNAAWTITSTKGSISNTGAWNVGDATVEYTFDYPSSGDVITINNTGSGSITAKYVKVKGNKTKDIASSTIGASSSNSQTLEEKKKRRRH